ncbi:MAG: class I SAM-dependent methyltransferase [Candidatus Diapherotrites archaeon]|nr:class I SAM-dependent methyltransferase [Candidatus Diapherotrites archaeon]
MAPRKLKPTGPKPVSFSQFYRAHVLDRDPTKAESWTAMAKRDELGIDRLFPDKRSLRRAWDAYAKHQDLFLPESALRFFNNFVFSEGKFKGDEHILSIGSGTGALETFLAKHKVPKGKVIGVDISDEMNKRAKKVVEKSQTKNALFVTADAMKLPVKTGSQDVAILNNFSVAHPHEYPALVSETRRALKKSEHSKVIFIGGYSNPRLLQQTLSFWENGGFRIEKHVLKTLPEMIIGFFVFRLKQ